ncbi:MAG: type II toxin-antitoxin system RelE family toxin [Candidatus Omnitrophota bacterium]
MYKIKLISQAHKDLENLPSKIFARAKTAILSLSQIPRPQGAIKLTEQEGYRIRLGDYRILYRIDDAAKEIYIYRIKHRKDAYR